MNIRNVMAGIGIATVAAITYCALYLSIVFVFAPPSSGEIGVTELAQSTISRGDGCAIDIESMADGRVEIIYPPSGFYRVIKPTDDSNTYEIVEEGYR